jgi:integrase
MTIGKLKGRAKGYRTRVTIGGKKKSFYFKTKKELDTFKAKHLINPELTMTAVNNKKVLFGVFAKEFLEKKATEVRYATQLKYSESIRLYLNHHFEYLNLREIQEEHIEQFKKWLTELDIALASRVFHFNFLRSILKKARLKGLITSDPFIDIKCFPKPKPREEVWSLEELQKFLNFHNFNPRLIVYLLAANIGCRIGELWALTETNIDFASGRVEINGSYCQKTGVIGPTKNGQKRIAYLPQAVCEVIAQLVDFKTNSFIIPRDLPGLKDPGHVARVLRRDCLAAGVKSLCFHQLRHTWTTLFVEKTGNVKLAMEILGHSSLEMTNRYLHITDKAKVNNRNALSLVPNFPLGKLIEVKNAEVAQ